jgi:hypothetical protein
MHDEAGSLQALLDGPGAASAFSRRCTNSAMSATALDGEPASKAGLGSHSVATWTPCASCGSCMRLRKGKGHVDGHALTLRCTGADWVFTGAGSCARRVRRCGGGAQNDSVPVAVIMPTA